MATPEITNAERFQRIVENLGLERILQCPTCQIAIPYQLGPRAKERIAGNIMDRGIDERITQCPDNNCGKYFLRIISREFGSDDTVSIVFTKDSDVVTILNSLVDSLREFTGQNAALRTEGLEAQQRHLQELNAVRKELEEQIDDLLDQRENLETHTRAAQEKVAELREKLDELQTPDVQGLAAQAAASSAAAMTEPKAPAVLPPPDNHHFATPSPPPRAVRVSSPRIHRPPPPQKPLSLLARVWDFLRKTPW